MTNKKFKETWFKVAEAYGKEDADLVLTHNGLCYAFAEATGSTYNSTEYLWSYKILDKFNPPSAQDSWFPTNIDNYSLRCLFACLFASMTLKEFEQICNSENK